MKLIGFYTSKQEHRPSMMLWSLAGTFIACKELWSSVNQRNGSFSDNGWDGYLLTHLTRRYMKHVELPSPRGPTPFKKGNTDSFTSMLGKIEPFMPSNMQVHHPEFDEDREGFSSLTLSIGIYCFQVMIILT